VQKRKKQAGKDGESTVASVIQNIAPIQAKIINDLVLLDKNRETYQIDHLFISTNGIWIIETKNWSGTIYGEEANKYWVQKKRYNTEKRYNPIKQNFGHYYKIKPLLDKYTPIHCLVVFINADISNIQSEYICSLKDLPSILLRKTNDKLTEVEIKRYYNKFIYLKEKFNISSEQHERMIEDKKKEIALGVCPRCGGKLVERKGLSGLFYGCKNYPKCKFTIDKLDKSA
jgi:hypothetical protein